MNQPEPCLCGATDCPICGPMQGYRLTQKDEIDDFCDPELEWEDVQ